MPYGSVDAAVVSAQMARTRITEQRIAEALGEAEIAIDDATSGLAGDALEYAEAIAEMLNLVLGGSDAPHEVPAVLSPRSAAAVRSWLGEGHGVVEMAEWSVRLPHAIATSNLLDVSLYETHSYLAPTAPELALAVVVSDVMKRLLRPIELRTRPYSERFVVEVVRDAVNTAALLGLDPKPLARLWSPELSGDAFIAEFTIWVRGWRDALPLSPARAMAAATSPLRGRYLKAQGRKPSARRDKVMTVALEPLLGATLRTWPAFVRFLGRPLAPEDAELDATDSVAARVPETLPQAVVQRHAAVQAWFRWLARAMFASLGPTAVPPSALSPRRSGFTTQHDWVHGTAPRELIGELESLWRLDNDDLPGAFGGLVEPAAEVWTSPASCLWHMFNGPGAHPTWAEQAGYHRRTLEKLTAMGAPVPDAFWDQIASVSFPEYALVPTEVIEVDWEAADWEAVAAMSDGDDGEAFEPEWVEEEEPPTVQELVEPVWQRFRNTVPPLVDAWTEEALPTYLTMQWRTDAAGAVEGYRVLRERGQWGSGGAPATPLAKVTHAADRWFRGDVDALLAVLTSAGE